MLIILLINIIHYLFVIELLLYIVIYLLEFFFYVLLKIFITLKSVIKVT